MPRCADNARAYQAVRTALRRKLYATDPLYRLSKLKANWEDREYKRRLGLKERRIDGGREWRA